MLIFFISFIVLLGFIEIYKMARQKLYSEIVAYGILIVITGICGFIYFKNPDDVSFVRAVFSMFEVR